MSPRTELGRYRAEQRAFRRVIREEKRRMRARRTPSAAYITFAYLVGRVRR